MNIDRIFHLGSHEGRKRRGDGEHNELRWLNSTSMRHCLVQRQESSEGFVIPQNYE